MTIVSAGASDTRTRYIKAADFPFTTGIYTAIMDYGNQGVWYPVGQLPAASFSVSSPPTLTITAPPVQSLTFSLVSGNKSFATEQFIVRDTTTNTDIGTTTLTGNSVENKTITVPNAVVGHGLSYRLASGRTVDTTGLPNTVRAGHTNSNSGYALATDGNFEGTASTEVGQAVQLKLICRNWSSSTKVAKVIGGGTTALGPATLPVGGEYLTFTSVVSYPAGTSYYPAAYQADGTTPAAITIISGGSAPWTPGPEETAHEWVISIYNDSTAAAANASNEPVVSTVTNGTGATTTGTITSTTTSPNGSTSTTVITPGNTGTGQVTPPGTGGVPTPGGTGTTSGSIAGTIGGATATGPSTGTTTTIGGTTNQTNSLSISQGDVGAGVLGALKTFQDVQTLQGQSSFQHDRDRFLTTGNEINNLGQSAATTFQSGLQVPSSFPVPDLGPVAGHPDGMVYDLPLIGTFDMNPFRSVQASRFFPVAAFCNFVKNLIAWSSILACTLWTWRQIKQAIEATFWTPPRGESWLEVSARSVTVPFLASATYPVARLVSTAAALTTIAVLPSVYVTWLTMGFGSSGASLAGGAVTAVTSAASPIWAAIQLSGNIVPYLTLFTVLLQYILVSLAAVQYRAFWLVIAKFVFF